MTSPSKKETCTCGEPHISDMVVHCYNGKPYYLKPRVTPPKEEGRESQILDLCVDYYNAVNRSKEAGLAVVSTILTRIRLLLHERDEELKAKIKNLAEMYPDNSDIQLILEDIINHMK